MRRRGRVVGRLGGPSLVPAGSGVIAGNGRNGRVCARQYRDAPRRIATTRGCTRSAGAGGDARRAATRLCARTAVTARGRTPWAKDGGVCTALEPLFFTESSGALKQQATLARIVRGPLLLVAHRPPRCQAATPIKRRRPPVLSQPFPTCSRSPPHVNLPAQPPPQHENTVFPLRAL